MNLRKREEENGRESKKKRMEDPARERQVHVIPALLSLSFLFCLPFLFLYCYYFFLIFFFGLLLFSLTSFVDYQQFAVNTIIRRA